MEKAVIDDNIRAMAEVTKQIENLKAKKDQLDVFFSKLAEEDLKDSKCKSVAYSSEDITVTATMAKKVLLQYPNFIMRVFKDLTKDIIQTETKQVLSTVGKRILGSICNDEFIRQTVDEAIDQIVPERSMIPIMRKKLRGKNYENDIKNLMAITGCSYEKAAEDAYIIAEAAAWQELRSIMMVNNIPEERWQEMIDNIKTGVIVEEQPKIKVEIRES